MRENNGRIFKENREEWGALKERLHTIKGHKSKKTFVVRY